MIGATPPLHPHAIGVETQTKQGRYRVGDTLTAKQARFAKLVAGTPDTPGLTKAAAYREAYDADNMTKKSSAAAAYELGKQPKIKAAIAKLTTIEVEVGRAVEAELERVTRDWVTKRLQLEADMVGNPPASRIRALELLGKTQGMFKDVISVESDVRTEADIEREIQAKLSSLFGGESTTPVLTTPAPAPTLDTPTEGVTMLALTPGSKPPEA